MVKVWLGLGPKTIWLGFKIPVFIAINMAVKVPTASQKYLLLLPLIRLEQSGRLIKKISASVQLSVGKVTWHCHVYM